MVKDGYLFRPRMNLDDRINLDDIEIGSLFVSEEELLHNS